MPRPPAAPAAGKVIGHVTKLTGTATAIRNGVSIILNKGDNVEKGDVVQSGSNSTVGITFIDGTVFGLSSNARMVLNEMVYDPNGSNNSSLISLVAGTISFVAGETAKHGDMKVDTPVATMGIRGTAVLVEIDFYVPGQNGAPDAKFQVLVEPDGTTGSYILFDKTTLAPIATVNQAGQQINIHRRRRQRHERVRCRPTCKSSSPTCSRRNSPTTTRTPRRSTNFTDTLDSAVRCRRSRCRRSDRDADRRVCQPALQQLRPAQTQRPDHPDPAYRSGADRCRHQRLLLSEHAWRHRQTDARYRVRHHQVCRHQCRRPADGDQRRSVRSPTRTRSMPTSPRR